MSNSETLALAAHVSGTVLEVNVRPGDTVHPGDTVMTIESMKMHMPLEASARGVVKSLLVEVGDEVEEGQQVAELTAAAA